MDLDFSFALVSSLTPRRKAEKSKTAEISRKTDSLKTRFNFPKSQKRDKIFEERREDKENLLPEEQLMNQDELFNLSESKRNPNPSDSIQRKQSHEKYDFSINMENIVVRRNRPRERRGRKQITSPLQPCEHFLERSNGNSENEIQSPRTSDIIIVSSDIDENSPKGQLFKNRNSKIIEKSPNLHVVSNSSIRSSLEVVESSISEVKRDSYDNCISSRLLSAKKLNVKTRPTRASGKSESSLSTAYDSDSFQATGRKGTKVILETPDTDKSATEGNNEKRKSSFSSLISEENKEYSLRSGINNSPKNAKRKSSELNDSLDGNNKRPSVEKLHIDSRPKRKSSQLGFISEKNKQLSDLAFSVENETLETSDTACNNQILSNKLKPSSKNKTETRLKKALQANNDCTMLDMFKLESTIKDQSLPNELKGNEMSKTNLGETCRSNSTDGKDNTSDISKGRNLKIIDLTKPDPVKKKRTKEKEAITQKNVCRQTTDDNEKGHCQKTKNKQLSPLSQKVSALVLPSETIPKFEHINKWLKDTEEKIRPIGLLENNSVTTNRISNKDVMPVKNKYKISLSPRIKKKKDKAKSSLEEEQKLFEELYGADYEKRLSDDINEVASSQDSVEFSENVLDKFYGTVWQKDTAVTQSEPRKGRRKNKKNKTPFTEKKKHRTSIYEVFSSSSSEDRFEEFLENVRIGKVKSTKRLSGRPGTPEFINDSDSEDNDNVVFYQNIVSSAVKEEVNNIKDIKAGKDVQKVNRRRLSFGSSQDDGCSESGKSDTKPKSKGKKSSYNDNTKTKKSRSKKKTYKCIDQKAEDGIDIFSLVTPLKIKGKKTTEIDCIDDIKNPEVPRSVGKSKTPRNPTRKKDLSNSEEGLKTTYLKENDFKVPKSASSTLRTPTKSIKPDVPSSPALSFLSSLSEMTAGLPCHPDALIYKKNFKTKREELTKRLFNLYNKEVFDNKLPGDMLIQWSTRMTSTSGYCYNKRIYRDNQILRSSRIVLSTKILDRADRLRDTLIHELCHAATWIVHATSDGHGPLWRSWADKANRRFPELPVIKRCHDYAISTKFTYKCMSCGYSIGRHTKSLDTERKRCGYCFGKFQVFVTAKMSTASITSGSDSVKTPRNPTGFALFVKENYANIKKENNVPHAQVMKLLSQKFAEVKISKQNAEDTNVHK